MVVLRPAHDEGLDEVTRLDAPRSSGLLEAPDPAMAGHGVLDARLTHRIDRRGADGVRVTTLGGVVAVRVARVHASQPSYVVGTARRREERRSS